jgi:hypothetical protein
LRSDKENILLIWTCLTGDELILAANRENLIGRLPRRTLIAVCFLSIIQQAQEHLA